MSKPSYSVLEKKYERLATAYFNLKERHVALQRRAESFKDDAKSAQISRKMTEREFRGYLTAGQRSLQSYREIIKMAAGRLTLHEDPLADRLRTYLDNMGERVQPVADMKKLTDLLDAWVRGDGDPVEARLLLAEIRGFDVHDVSALSIEADD
jgi:hypothetical protein